MTSGGEVKGASTFDLTLASAQSGTAKQVAAYPETITLPRGAIAAREYALYHVESGKIVAQSDQMDKVPIGSTTKLMTALLVSRILKPDDQIVISKEAANQIGSLMNIRQGDTFTVDALLHGLLMVSGNDAAYQFGATAGGVLLGNPDAPITDRVARFVQEMNAEAKTLHMDNTQYFDPAGLNDDGHSTAVDLTKVANAVYTTPQLVRVINTATITVSNVAGTRSYPLQNSNRMLTEFAYDGEIGGKTGFTPEAGHCLVSIASRNGNTYIAVVLNTYDTAADASARVARDLMNAAFTQVQYL